MKSLKNTTLYSRLALATSVTLVVGYFVVYAWTTLDPADAGPTKTLTATLMQGIVNNINDLNTRVSNFGFSSGNVGIGMGSPVAKLDIKSGGTQTYPFSIKTFGNSGEVYVWNNLTNDPGIGIRNSSGVDTVYMRPDGNSYFNGGNVGIGTATPGTKLEINQTNDASSLRISSNQAGYLSSNQSVLQINTTNGTSNPTASYALSANYNGTSLFNVRNDGYVGVGRSIADTTTTGVGIYPSGAIHIVDPTTSVGGEFMILNNNVAGTHTNTAISFRRNNVGVGSITFTSTATAYNTTSDYRLKENVVDLTGALERISRLPVHRFDFKSNPQITVDGFLAHEVQMIVPESVTGKKDAVDADGNPIYQQVDYSKVVPLLTAGIRELRDQNDILRAENSDMKARIEYIESLLR